MSNINLCNKCLENRIFTAEEISQLYETKQFLFCFHKYNENKKKR